jgi:hypothetical protein
LTISSFILHAISISIIYISISIISISISNHFKFTRDFNDMMIRMWWGMGAGDELFWREFHVSAGGVGQVQEDCQRH